MDNLSSQIRPFSLLNQVIDISDKAMESIYGEDNYRVITQHPDENATFPCIVISEINNTPNTRYSTICNYRSVTNLGYEFQFYSNKSYGANEQNMQNWQIIDAELNKIGLHQSFFSSDVPNINNRHIKRMVVRYAGRYAAELEGYFP